MKGAVKGRDYLLLLLQIVLLAFRKLYFKLVQKNFAAGLTVCDIT